MMAKGKIFLLDGEEIAVSRMATSLRGEGYEVQGETDARGVVAKIRTFAPDVVLLDLVLRGRSGTDVLKEITDAGIATRVVMLVENGGAGGEGALQMGATDYVTKPFDVEVVRAVVDPLLAKQRPQPAPTADESRAGYLRKTNPELTRGELIGTSEIVHRLRDSATKLARAGVPSVLITGENGTGKELLARYIHRQIHGDDADHRAPFIGINCAALPEYLIESELFGHEKGAFTDAKAEKDGVFELATGGTILLDEIGEMKWNLQAKLLRALEEWTYRRVGGRHDIPIQATVFATTNRDLREAVRKREFRIDLYYRLSTFSVAIPPLRDRPEDVLPLAEHFLEVLAEKYGRRRPMRISEEAMSLLVAHEWPGNVRELRNTIERIVVLETGTTVLAEHLPREIASRAEPAAAQASGPILLPEEGISLEDLESTLIVQALTRTGRNKAQAAKLLGITYDSLRYQVKKLGLD